MERGRFAPTPSGALHLGSARTALASALSVWSRGGVWALRIEDLDAARTPPGATAALLDDLHWLGLHWDEGPVVGGPSAPYVQSQRRDHYTAALDALVGAGRAYPCSCSRRDVEQAAQAPHGAEPVYPGRCRDREPAEVLAEAVGRGRGVSWRFRVDALRDPVTVVDALAGTHTEDVARAVGDFVVFRADGVAAYQLAVVVDDIAMGVTEVVRGEDLLGSTARQVLLYEALGAPPPRWAHVPLVLAEDGNRLAKRLGSMALRELRAAGVSPTALGAALLGTLGARADGGPLRSAARGFELASIPRGPVRWRPGEGVGDFRA